MKRVVLSLLTIVASICCQAAGVSEKQAMEKARAFIREQTGGRRAAAHIKLQTAQIGVKHLHPFNVEGGGFIIVSASDCTEAVLGYSATGGIDDHLPPAMTALLQSYAHQITEAEQRGSEAAQSTSFVKQAIEPLITTKWGQDAPYHNLTPTAEKDGHQAHCPTGCVATAMAMLMKYHQWPQGQTEVIPATTFYDEDLPATTFDWAAMTDTYDENSSKSSCDAVALLMKYCGAACKMNYNFDQSASNSTQLTLGMIRYMGYDSQHIQVARRTHFSESEWQNLIYSELFEKRPVIAGGDGHEFIIDGFQTGDYFHINWGWDGSKDGYFRLSVTGGKLAPSTQIHHFPYDVITGIKPTRSPYVHAETLETSGLILSPDTPLQMERSGDTDFAEVKALLTLHNVCSHQDTYTFDVGMGLYKDGLMQKMWEISNDNEVDYDDYLENQQAQMTFGQGLADGHYRLYPLSRLSGTQLWERNEDVSPEYIDVEISGERMTLKPVPRDYRFTINDFKVSGDLTTGGEVTVLMNITNGSDYDYDGAFILADDRDGTLMKAGTLNETFYTLRAGETADVPFTFIAGEAKTYNLCLMHEIFLLGPRVAMQIQDADDNPPDDYCLIEKTVTMKNGQHTGKDPYGLSIYQIKGRVLDATVTLRNTDPTVTYRGMVQLDIEYENPTDHAVERLLSLPRQNVTIAPGQTQDVYFRYDHLDRMKSYFLNLRTTYDGDVNNDSLGLYAIMEMVTGINVFLSDHSVQSMPPTATFEVPSDAAAVELYDAGVTTLIPNDNPNCLYFLGKADTQPASLAGHNVVIYDNATETATAEQLTLSDRHAFTSPIVFTAKEARYERTFTEAEHNGYTTLALPFQVQKCEADAPTFSMNLYALYADQPGQVYIVDDGPLPQAGKPYLLQLKAETPQATPVTFSAHNVDIIPAVRQETAGHYTMTGTYLHEHYTQGEHFGFSLGESGTSLPKTNTCHPFRASFQTIGLPSLHDTLLIDTTPILPTAIVAPRSKAPQNDEPYYTPSGHRTTHPHRGIYIRGGKKIIVKFISDNHIELSDVY